MFGPLECVAGEAEGVRYGVVTFAVLVMLWDQPISIHSFHSLQQSMFGSACDLDCDSAALTNMDLSAHFSG